MDQLQLKLSHLEAEKEVTYTKLHEITDSIDRIRKKIDVCRTINDQSLTDSLVFGENSLVDPPNKLDIKCTNDPGTPGQMSFDDLYLYICIAPNTWRRLGHVVWVNK